MAKQLDMEIKVGLFVSLGTALIMLAILLLGGAESLFVRHNKYQIHFPSIEGLIVGAKVVLGGVQVGTVSNIDFDHERKDVEVQIKVARKYETWIRKSSAAEIKTQGVLGDKFISLEAGSADDALLTSGAEIQTRPIKDLSQFISKGDSLMVSLNSIASSLDRMLKSFEEQHRSEIFFQGMAATAKNLSEASKKLNSEMDQLPLKSMTKNMNGILEKINNGTGTLGALVNDPGLYYDARALMGGANRNRIIRNLVRKTIKDAEPNASTMESPAQ